MSNSVQSLQAINTQTQTEHTVQPPKKPQTITQASSPQDTVTISQAAKQSHIRNAKSSGGNGAGSNG